jgi:hypothetical protein
VDIPVYSSKCHFRGIHRVPKIRSNPGKALEKALERLFWKDLVMSVLSLTIYHFSSFIAPTPTNGPKTMRRYHKYGRDNRPKRRYIIWVHMFRVLGVAIQAKNPEQTKANRD